MATIDHVLPPCNRVIRITNVHFGADEEAIRDFFTGYTIENQYRTINTRTRTKSIVYVLFATGVDKIRACKLSGGSILGRVIKIQPAPSGNYRLNEEGTAFVEPITSKPSACISALSITSPQFDETDFPQLVLTEDKTSTPVTPSTTIAELPGKGPIPLPTIKTASSDNDTMSDARAQAPGAQDEASKKPQANNNKAYSLFPNAAESHMETVKDHDINARDAATAAFDEKVAKIQADDKNSFTWRKSTRGPPPGIDTTIPPSKKNWNLAGHDANDRSKNIITEADWYDFMPKQHAKVEQLQKARGTNADAIVREGGGYEEVTKVEAMK